MTSELKRWSGAAVPAESSVAGSCLQGEIDDDGAFSPSFVIRKGWVRGLSLVDFFEFPVLEPVLVDHRAELSSFEGGPASITPSGANTIIVSNVAAPGTWQDGDTVLVTEAGALGLQWAGWYVFSPQMGGDWYLVRQAGFESGDALPPFHRTKVGSDGSLWEDVFGAAHEIGTSLIYLEQVD